MCHKIYELKELYNSSSPVLHIQESIVFSLWLLAIRVYLNIFQDGGLTSIISQQMWL